MTLARISTNCKRQTHLLVREDVTTDYHKKFSVEKKRVLVESLKGLVAKTN
jgi:hypothetical protein